MRIVWPTFLMLAVGTLALGGCLQPNGPATPVADPDDGMTTLALQVVDAISGNPLAKVKVDIRVPGVGTLHKTTDDDGRAAANLKPAPACSITLSRLGYVGGAIALDCSEDRSVRIPLNALGNLTPNGTALPGLASGMALLQANVLDDATGAPIVGARVRLDPPFGPLAHSNETGGLEITATLGPHALQVTAPCLVMAQFDVELRQSMALDLRVTRSGEVPGPPSGVRATAGPGAGMVTVSWADSQATGYRILRNGEPFHDVAHSLAYGVPGAVASDRFSVSALDGCGLVGAASADVSAAPLPGTPPTVVSPRQQSATVADKEYPAFDANGTPLGLRPWRTVKGTGNCCENYMATTPSGRILDQGGSNLAFSDDEGLTWSYVKNQAIVLDGEGSVAAAPDGDIVAFDWATYNADTAFAYRYSAATQTWHSQPVAKAPAYDRPWIATIKGPFFVDNVVVPYISVVEGGVGLKDPLLISLDGLTYVPSNSIINIGEATVDLRGFTTMPDANRDWLPPMSEFGIVPLDNGVGIMEKQSAMQGTPTWRGVNLPQLPGEILRVDSAGAWHAAGVDGRRLTYAISHDAGANWDTTGFEFPEGWSVGGEWDFRANAELDQAAFAVNADVNGSVQQAVVRFRGLDGVPVATEFLHVGGGDGAFGSGVTASGNRFDFMTLGFLPDGRIVLSIADATDTAPFLAVELPH